MQRNKVISEEKVGKGDRVVQTNPEDNEREVGKADRVFQTDPTTFEREEEEKMYVSSADSETKILKFGVFRP